VLTALDSLEPFSAIPCSFPKPRIEGRLHLKEKIVWEEVVTLLAAVLTIFKVVFWLCLIAVAGLFLFALICETIESFRSHNRGQLKLRHKFRQRGAARH
jgi:hypothetical protein